MPTCCSSTCELLWIPITTGLTPLLRLCHFQRAWNSLPTVWTKAGLTSEWRPGSHEHLPLMSSRASEREFKFHSFLVIFHSISTKKELEAFFCLPGDPWCPSLNTGMPHKTLLQGRVGFFFFFFYRDRHVGAIAPGHVALCHALSLPHESARGIARSCPQGCRTTNKRSSILTVWARLCSKKWRFFRFLAPPPPRF